MLLRMEDGLKGSPWINLLDLTSLSPKEKSSIEKFNKSPESRAFLAVADILRSQKLYTESLELLADGVSRHPNYSGARVVLVRDLLDRGMVSEAWEHLENAPQLLKMNVMAQKLRLKLSILIGKTSVAKATIDHMKSYQMLEIGIRRLVDLFEGDGVVAARNLIVTEFKKRGTELMITDLVDEVSTLVDESGYEKSGLDDISALGESDGVDGFRVHSLDEIFSSSDNTEGEIFPETVELDSTTLAEIYARQEHYGKALAIYKRLLRLSPSSDYLKQKVVEMTKLNRSQKDEDRELDPSAVERMETLEVIDVQIQYLHSLLERLR